MSDSHAILGIELFCNLTKVYKASPRRRTIFGFLQKVPREHWAWLWEKAERELLRDTATVRHAPPARHHSAQPGLHGGDGSTAHRRRRAKTLTPTAFMPDGTTCKPTLCAMALLAWRFSVAGNMSWLEAKEVVKMVS